MKILIISTLFLIYSRCVYF